VEFLGFVDEQQKRELYARAKALVYPPQNEDFGMVPVEAMAAGRPSSASRRASPAIRFRTERTADCGNAVSWSMRSESSNAEVCLDRPGDRRVCS